MSVQNNFNHNAEIIVGLQANRPSANSISAGVFFFGVNTGNLYINTIGTNNVRAWVQVGSGGGAGKAVRFWAGALQTASSVVSPVTVTAFLADDLPTVLSTQMSVIGYPVPFACTVSNLQVNVLANASQTNSTVTVYKNGAPTSLTVTVVALTQGLVTDFSDTVSFVQGDQIDLFITNTGGGGGTISLSASVQLS